MMQLSEMETTELTTALQSERNEEKFFMPRRKPKIFLKPTVKEMLPIILIFFLTFFSILLLGLYVSSRNTINVLNTCQTPICIEASHKILSSMNLSVDPCEDFYRYACEGWIENNIIPSGKNAWSVFSEISKKSQYVAKRVLESESSTYDSRSLLLAKTFYESCLNEQAIDDLDLNPLFDSLTKYFGGWVLIPKELPGSRLSNATDLMVGSYDLTSSFQPFLQHGLSTDLFRLSIENDPLNSKLVAITITSSFLSLEAEYYLNQTHQKFQKVVESFKSVMIAYARILGVPKENIKEMDHVFELEVELAKRMELKADQYNKPSAHEMKIHEIQKFCPVVNWLKLLNFLYEPINHTFTENETLVITDKSFLEQRCILYDNYTKSNEKIRILHNAAVWRFIWATNSQMPTRVWKILKDFHRILTGIKETSERWENCLSITERWFGMPIARKFIESNFKEEHKVEAVAMTKRIKEEFIESFTNIYWLEDNAREEARKKVRKLEESIGYPPEIYDIAREELPYVTMDGLHIDKYFENNLKVAFSNALSNFQELFNKTFTKWEMAPHTVNAFYNPQKNQIFFPAGILQRPFFYMYYPLPMNYGGIGVAIGHEIVHAFDQKGSNYDADGNLRELWSNSTRKKFEEKAHCFVDQYSTFKLENISINGNLTLSENIADNGGFKVSFRAFQKARQIQKDPLKLPGVKLNDDQIFFLSFAQLWCRKQNAEANLQSVYFDPHSPENVRVLGTVMNSVEFAEAFKCPKNSPMNPEKKCVLW